MRIGPVIAALGVGVAVAACGGGQSQASSEPKGNFPVAVDTASFPASQSLAQKTHLVIAVRNTGSKAIPDVAVTICNVTCTYPAPKGEGTSAAAFGENLEMAGLAHPGARSTPPGASAPEPSETITRGWRRRRGTHHRSAWR